MRSNPIPVSHQKKVFSNMTGSKLAVFIAGNTALRVSDGQVAAAEIISRAHFTVLSDINKFKKKPMILKLHRPFFFL